MVEWEYKTEYMPPEPERTLNALGRDGWELVQVRPNGEAILKRPKQQAALAPVAPPSTQGGKKFRETVRT